MEKNIFFDILKTKEERVGSGVGFGSTSQSYGSWDPDTHQNVMDPKHWLKH